MSEGKGDMKVKVMSGLYGNQGQISRSYGKLRCTGFICLFRTEAITWDKVQN